MFVNVNEKNLPIVISIENGESEGSRTPEGVRRFDRSLNPFSIQSAIKLCAGKVVEFLVNSALHLYQFVMAALLGDNALVHYKDYVRRHNC